jgi:hypothetical protein
MKIMLKLFWELFIICAGIFNTIYYWNDRVISGLMLFALGSLTYWFFTETLPDFIKAINKLNKQNAKNKKNR